MNKKFQFFLLFIIVALPFLIHRSFKPAPPHIAVDRSFSEERLIPHIALIFAGLGESLKPMDDLYSLRIPLTVSVIPGLRFSQNAAHIAHRSGFSVLINLPLSPKDRGKITGEYRVINGDLSEREVIRLLRYNLNSIRIAIGVSTHMGSRATEDERLMRLIMRELKIRGLIFVDSRASDNSVAFSTARDMGLVCGYNHGFLDSTGESEDVSRKEAIRNRLYELIELGKKQGKIIVVARFSEEVLRVIEEEINNLREKANFITIRDYFDM